MNTKEEWDGLIEGINQREEARRLKRHDASGREQIDCRKYINLLDELTTVFEFCRSLRKYRKRVGESPRFTFTIGNFKRAQILSKYKDEL